MKGFNVGDKVVSTNEFTNNMMFTISELTCDYAFTSIEFGEIDYRFVRHATNEEIKEGRRLNGNNP